MRVCARTQNLETAHMHKHAAHRHIVVDHENTILRQAKKFSDTKAVGFGHNILSESPQKLRPRQSYSAQRAQKN